MNLVGKKFAICGHPEFAEQINNAIKNFGAECKYFVTDFIIQDTRGVAM